MSMSGDEGPACKYHFLKDRIAGGYTVLVSDKQGIRAAYAPDGSRSLQPHRRAYSCLAVDVCLTNNMSCALKEPVAFHDIESTFAGCRFKGGTPLFVKYDNRFPQ